MSILLFLVFGLIVGAIARFVVSGRGPGGWLTSMVIGIVGSFVGAYLGRAAGLYREAEPAGFLMSVLGAILVTVVYHAVSSRRSSA